MSTYGGEDDIRRAFKSGVHAYLTKDVPHDELIQAIRAAHEGQMYLPAPIADMLNAQTSRPDLSARELDVLKLIVQGNHNKQIAWALGISLHTVKTHAKSILEKLDVDDQLPKQRQPRYNAGSSIFRVDFEGDGEEVSGRSRHAYES